MLILIEKIGMTRFHDEESVGSLERLLKFVIDDVVWQHEHGWCITMCYSVVINVNIVANNFD